MKTKKWQLVIGLIACLGVLLWAATALAAAGAIFTSNADGTQVNGNIYEAKEDVYLNGGPNGPCGSAGLPDGDYYFQVTNPSGTELYSTDDISNRLFTVLGGIITDYSGTHKPGTGKCPGGISIQLFPYDDTTNPGGEYKVWATPVDKYVSPISEGPPPVFPATPNNKFGFVDSDSKTDNFKVRESVPPGGLTLLTITGYKFYDANTSGTWQNPPEVPIQGWKVVLTFPDTTTAVTYTGITGQYSFLVSVPADAPSSITYTIREEFPGTAWHPTTPTSGTVTFDGGPTTLIGPDFGNVCLGAGGGLTLGFWSNKNGKATMDKYGMAAELAMLTALNLKTALGENFDPSTYDQFRTWLLSANATNMAYMLSAQLAAMELNVFNGKVDPNALVYAPDLTQPGHVPGFVTVQFLMDAANISLNDHPLTVAAGPDRTAQEALKNDLDRANNNGTFVQPGPCTFLPY